jgi:hypothetical protein
MPKTITQMAKNRKGQFAPEDGQPFLEGVLLLFPEA